MPPTFIWNEVVEQAWVSKGVQIIVTPGSRLERRAKDGKPISAGSPIRNCERSAAGAVYAVRNGYFEPAFGHTAAHALGQLECHWRRRRPTLLETHRFNFTDRANSERSFGELETLLNDVSARYHDVRFMSTAELVDGLIAGDPALVETRFSRKVRAWLERLKDVSGLRKLAWVTGIGVAAWLVLSLTRSADSYGTDTLKTKAVTQ